MLHKYPARVEQALRLTYATLNERQRRLLVATEAIKLGHGSQAYLSRLFGCHRKTIQRGLQELRRPPSTLKPGQARKKGVDADRA